MTQILTADLLPAVSGAVADLVERVVPSIVQVHGRPRRPASGLVVASDRVLTTSHSVEWEDGVTVRTHDGRVVEATVAGHAAGADLVLLKVSGLGADPLRDSAEPVRAGHLVVVAGRGWSGRPHVRLLAVSGVAGPIRGVDGTSIAEVVALPVPPYPGVSGSAVLDAHGRLAAIATAGIVQGRVLGLPADAVRGIVAAIEAHGGVTRGFLGITTQPSRLTPAQSEAAGQAQGLVVVGVSSDSPAASSGILVGDVLVGADGAAVSSAEDLLDVLAPGRIGSVLRLRVLRGRAIEDAPVTVAARPSRW